MKEPTIPSKRNKYLSKGIPRLLKYGIRSAIRVRNQVIVLTKSVYEVLYKNIKIYFDLNHIFKRNDSMQQHIICNSPIALQGEKILFKLDNILQKLSGKDPRDCDDGIFDGNSVIEIKSNSDVAENVPPNCPILSSDGSMTNDSTRTSKHNPIAPKPFLVSDIQHIKLRKTKDNINPTTCKTSLDSTILTALLQVSNKGVCQSSIPIVESCMPNKKKVSFGKANSLETTCKRDLPFSLNDISTVKLKSTTGAAASSSTVGIKNVQVVSIPATSKGNNKSIDSSHSYDPKPIVTNNLLAQITNAKMKLTKTTMETIEAASIPTTSKRQQISNKISHSSNLKTVIKPIVTNNLLAQITNAKMNLKNGSKKDERNVTKTTTHVTNKMNESLPISSRNNTG